MNKHAIFLILLIIITIAIFANTLKNDFFVWDEQHMIVDNAHNRSLKNIPLFFTPRYWNYHFIGIKGQYRPIRAITFAIDYFLWQMNPFGYHLTNMIFHVLNVILVYFCIFKLPGSSKKIAFLTAAFFASHPVHVESIAWIKNRTELLALLFLLLSFLLFIQFINSREKRARILSYCLCLACFIFGLFSKEIVIAFPLILVIFVLYFYWKKEDKYILTRTFPFFAIAVFDIIFKTVSLKMLAPSARILELGLYNHALAVIKTIGFYIKLLLLPINLSVGHIFDIPKSFFQLPVFVYALLLLVLIYMAIRCFKHSRLMSFAILWFLIMVLPIANILFIKIRPLGEGRLYIPSLGFCLLLGVAIDRIKLKKSAILSAAVILIMYSSLTINRNFDWKNSVLHWQREVSISPNSHLAHFYLGASYYFSDRKEEAIKSYKRVVEINPNYSEAHYNMGIVYENMNKIQKAIASYRQATELNPLHAKACYNLGVLYYRTDRIDEAIIFYRQAIKANSQYAKCYNNLAEILYSSGNTKEAIVLYKKAIGVNPYYANAYYNLASIYRDIGKKDMAIEFFKNVLKINPNDTEARNNITGLNKTQNKNR